MLKLLIDTCVWIDVAKDYHPHAVLQALSHLAREKKVLVLVPPLVRDEFERNKGNIVEKHRQSLSSTLKRAKEILDQHGEPVSKDQALEALNYVDQRLPRLGDLTGITAFVEQLLKHAESVPISDAAKLRAAARALAKKAPFHRNKHSVADAILIEAFADVTKAKDSKGHKFGFVTHNKNDFSMTEGDTRQHHPDFAGIFTRRKVRYYSTLKEALLTVESEVIDQLQFDEYSEQPRSTDDIVALIGELLDKVWYNQHLYFRQEVQEGRETCDPKVMAGAIRSARMIEERYGKKNLGPYSDFDWGMVNGKLSALRWIFGEDWETTLDT
jgi:hypothetical protein